MSLFHANPIFRAAGLLDHDHGVRSGGQRRARHDFHGFGRSERAVENFAGANFADQPQFSRHVLRADGVAIASRTREWRIVAIGGNVFRKDAPGGFSQADLFRFVAASSVPDHALACIVEGKSHCLSLQVSLLHELKLVALVKQSADIQPLISMRRMAVARPVDSSTSTTTPCSSAPWRAASIRTGICVRKRSRMMSLSTPMTEW